MAEAPTSESRVAAVANHSKDEQGTESKDSGKFWWAIIGFFLPPVGLVL